MANTNLTKARGLVTFSNYLDLPPGALLKAKNVNIDRDGIIEPRRGFGEYLELDSKAKQLLVYKNTLLVHKNGKIAWDDNGVVNDFNEEYKEVEEGLRIKYIEANGNLFITTESGIKKISATNDLSNTDESLAGPISAVDIYAKTNYTSAGFFSQYSKVAYRVVWGKKDKNENLILGAPSERFEVINSANSSCTVDLEISIPKNIDTSYFYQVYRSSVFQINLSSSDPLGDLSNISSDDELRLVYEAGYDGSSSITFNDITPLDFRDGGLPLYTNGQSGEGILQSNYRPPYAHDISSYKNSTFFSNTKTYQKLDLAMLGTAALTDLEVTSISGDPVVTVTTLNPHNLTTGDRVVVFGSQGVSSDGTFQVTVTGTNTFEYNGDATGANASKTSLFTSYLIINKDTTSERYFFVGRPEIYTLDFTGTVVGTNLVSGDYFDLYSIEDEKHYVIHYNVDSSPNEPNVPGAIFIEVPVSTGDSPADVVEKTAEVISDLVIDFIAVKDNNILEISTSSSGSATNPSIGAGLGSVTITVEQEGIGEDLVNNYVVLSTLESPSQKLDETARSLSRVINSNSNIVTCRYVSTVNDTPGKMILEETTLSDDSFTIFANNDDVAKLFNPDISEGLDSSNERSPNRIYFSKYSQPEHVPIVNYIDIGPKDKKIIRIVGLRDSLFIFKEEGIYRLSGENSNNFSVTLFDNSATLIAPDSVSVLNNHIYCLTTQGIVSVSETGVSVISRNIENTILKVSNNSFTNFKTATFSISSETDRSYILFTVKNFDDEHAQIAYRYNTFTQTWTSWEKSAICGLLKTSDDTIYLGADDVNLIEKERKNSSRRDYADRTLLKTFLKNSFLGNQITLSSTTGVDSGDVISQTQYVTISQFNGLVNRLDIDPKIKHPTINDYFSSISMSPGDDLDTSIENLTIKLLTRDPGGGYTYITGGNFANIQTQFNALIDNLNSSPNVFYSNYKHSTGTVDIEVRVVSVNINNNQIKINQIAVNKIADIIPGIATVYKAIPIEVVWAPNHFGSPELMKHIRESTLMFENTAIAGASFGFNTDLSGYFEDISFLLEGDGTWSNATWSEFTWGGEGTAVPFRTYVPRNKQRCRFIRARFKNNNTFDKFAIIGISFVFEMNSERAYK